MEDSRASNINEILDRDRGGRCHDVAELLLDPIIGYHAIAFIFLLVVVMLASFIGRGPTLIAATTSALLWDFFFQLPRYSFRIESLDDQILFGMYFVVALVLGQLTAKN